MLPTLEKLRKAGVLIQGKLKVDEEITYTGELDKDGRRCGRGIFEGENNHNESFTLNDEYQCFSKYYEGIKIFCSKID